MRREKPGSPLLLMPKRLDRVHPRRDHRRVEAKADPDQTADDEAAQHAPLRDAGWIMLIADLEDDPRQHLRLPDAQGDPDRSSGKRNHGRLNQKLKRNVPALGP